MKNATINRGVIKKIAFALGELNKQVIYVEQQWVYTSTTPLPMMCDLPKMWTSACLSLPLAS